MNKQWDSNEQGVRSAVLGTLRRSQTHYMNKQWDSYEQGVGRGLAVERPLIEWRVVGLTPRGRTELFLIPVSSSFLPVRINSNG